MTETIFKEFYAKKKNFLRKYICYPIHRVLCNFKKTKTQEKQNTKILSSSSCEYLISKLNLKKWKCLIPLLNELH